MNDLPELVAIPNLILCGRCAIHMGSPSRPPICAALHAADQVLRTRRAILAYYEALAVGRDARLRRDVAFLE